MAISPQGGEDSATGETEGLNVTIDGEKTHSEWNELYHKDI